jgi:glycosyltransferase involved in cell wall biosynthesis
MTNKIKIVALLPFKNEAHVLPSYLSTVVPLVEQVIAIDDASDDNSAEILREAGVDVYSWEQEKMKYGWAELGIRQRLLELGRETGGTHFVVLDADETFTRPFLGIAHKVLERLEPGQRVRLQWLAMWKSTDHYRDDNSVWSNNFKDFVFRDDGKIEYPKIWMHTPRTPGPFSNNEVDLVLNPKYGAVMHFQFSDWDRFQIKQSWLRMSEFVRDGNAAAVNNKYAITLDDENTIVTPTPSEWTEGIVLPKASYHDDTINEFWRLKRIEEFFEEYGPDYFKQLNIWHVPHIKELAKKYSK